MLFPLLRGWVMNAAYRETEMLGISSHRGIRKDSRPLSLSPCSLISLWGGLVDPRVRASNEVMDAPSKLARLHFREGVLLALPLRASNEGLLRPRVARAQESNRPPSRSFTTLRTFFRRTAW